MGALRKTEKACLTAAAVLLAFSAAVPPAVNRGAGADFSPADRTESAWTQAAAPVPYVRAAGADIDINSADAAALTLLPGIGEVLAGRIVQYREAHGAFGDIAEIMNVEGVGPATFAKIKDFIAAEEVS